MQRGDVGVVGDAGAQVGVQAEGLAQGDVHRLVAAALRRGDRPLEDDLVLVDGLPGVVADTGQQAALIGLETDGDGMEVEGRVRGLEDRQRGGHDLGANPIAGRDRNGGGGQGGGDVAVRGEGFSEDGGHCAISETRKRCREY
jgi:hypothetical protein